MVSHWARECVISQMMACVVLHSLKWRRSYIILREYHNESMFGETCVLDMTDPQMELLNLSQQYDVVQMAVGQYYGEDNDGVAREVPESVLPYPNKMWKWYEKWKEDGKKARNRPKDKESPGNKRSKIKPTTVFVDNEDDAAAFAALHRTKKSG